MSEEERRIGVDELEQGAAIEVERLHDAALGIFNGFVHLVGTKVNELHRQIGDEGLEP